MATLTDHEWDDKEIDCLTRSEQDNGEESVSYLKGRNFRGFGY